MNDAKKTLLLAVQTALKQNKRLNKEQRLTLAEVIGVVLWSNITYDEAIDILGKMNGIGLETRDNEVMAVIDHLMAVIDEIGEEDNE